MASGAAAIGPARNLKEDEALPRQLEQQDVRLAYAASPAIDKLAER